MSEISWVVCGDDVALTERLLDAISGEQPSERRATVAFPAELERRIAEESPQALLIGLGAQADAVLRTVESMPGARPALVVVGPEDDSRLILRSMRIGAREYLPHGATTEELRASVRSLENSLGLVTHSAARAKVVGVMGVKGGTGGTFVSCQLAASLRAAGDSVTLCDLDLRQGDVSLYFDLDPAYTVADVAKRTGEIDAAYLKTILHTDPSGVSILAAPRQMEEAELVGGRHVDTVAEVLGEDADWLIFDLARDFDDVTLRALDRLDLLMLVTNACIPALHHTRRRLELLERIGFSSTKTRLLLNRDSDKNPVSERDLVEFLERGFDAKLPNDFDAARECVSYGKSLSEAAPRTRLTNAFVDLAQSTRSWVGRGGDSDRANRRGLRGYLKRALHGAD
ncbi:MAG: AAA family ATPase [Myxococcales bacterium]|nr:AAA family ATPase [Myxococcales bacterium]